MVDNLTVRVREHADEPPPYRLPQGTRGFAR